MAKNNKRKGNGKGGTQSVTVRYTVYQEGESPIQRICQLDLNLSNTHGREGAIQEAKRLARPMVQRIEAGGGIRIEIDHVKINYK